MIIAGALSLVGAYVSNRLKSKFKYYSAVGVRSGLSGREVAEEMLRYYNITDVKVVPGQGVLTDHYNPVTKTVSLSELVYHLCLALLFLYIHMRT